MSKVRTVSTWRKRNLLSIELFFLGGVLISGLGRETLASDSFILQPFERIVSTCPLPSTMAGVWVETPRGSTPKDSSGGTNELWIPVPRIPVPQAPNFDVARPCPGLSLGSYSQSLVDTPFPVRVAGKTYAITDTTSVTVEAHSQNKQVYYVFRNFKIGEEAYTASVAAYNAAKTAAGAELAKLEVSLGKNGFTEARKSYLTLVKDYRPFSDFCPRLDQAYGGFPEYEKPLRLHCHVNAWQSVTKVIAVAPFKSKSYYTMAEHTTQFESWLQNLGLTTDLDNAGAVFGSLWSFGYSDADKAKHYKNIVLTSIDQVLALATAEAYKGPVGVIRERVRVVEYHFTAVIRPRSPYSDAYKAAVKAAIQKINRVYNDKLGNNSKARDRLPMVMDVLDENVWGLK